MSTLPDAIAELYRVFGGYRLGDDFSGCSHCVDPADTARLARTELASLSVEDLRYYASSAMTTWGEVEHFKHFLPRLLDLVGQGAEFLDLEILFGKLTLGRWHEWPDNERDSVRAFLRAFWLATLDDDDAQGSDCIDTVLCSLGNALEPLAEYLAEWPRLKSPARARRLAELAVMNLHDLREHKRLSNPFWENSPEQAQAVIAWLSAAETYEYLFDSQELLDTLAHKEAISELADWQLFGKS